MCAPLGEDARLVSGRVRQFPLSTGTKGAVFPSAMRATTPRPRGASPRPCAARDWRSWFDENELRGGDTWDAKIRKQIDACTLFVPVISTHTQERTKGYFRLEWKLAVDQTHLLAEGVPFIAPVVIDDTRESAAVVPPEFKCGCNGRVCRVRCRRRNLSRR